MPAFSSYDYVIVRVAPRVEREEFINAGVILYCRTRRFLDARIALDSTRLAALAPHIDAQILQQRLDLIPLLCAGGAAAGCIGQLSQAERFHWLVSPRSTIIQTSPVHSGLTSDPRATLQRLLQAMVLPAQDATDSHWPE